MLFFDYKSSKKEEYKSFIEKIREKEIPELLVETNKLRKLYFPHNISTCAIINAKSGGCTQDCIFCAQSRYHKTNIKRYPLLDIDTIVSAARQAQEYKVERFSIVTAGAFLPKKELNIVCKAIEKIRTELNIKPDASLGMLNKDDLMMLKKAGLTRYHHNLETAESYFKNICTTHTYNDRKKTIIYAKEVGLEVCSGGVFGLGESWEERLELAVALAELDVDSVPINFLNPIPNTRAANLPLLAPDEALRIIMMFRFVLPDKEIRVCGGREVVLGDFQSVIFWAGASAVMVGDYLTTKGRDIKKDFKMIEAIIKQ